MRALPRLMGFITVPFAAPETTGPPAEGGTEAEAIEEGTVNGGSTASVSAGPAPGLSFGHISCVRLTPALDSIANDRRIWHRRYRGFGSSRRAENRAIQAAALRRLRQEDIEGSGVLLPGVPRQDPFARIGALAKLT